MASQNETQGFTSLEEIETLILQLYHPGSPEKVAKTQETLQKLQRSPQGWQLAQGLLENKNESVRFFGALTFTVKLNTDSKSLSNDDAQDLLQNLVTWIIRCLENNEGPLVLRKLCSTLVTFFLHFSTLWIRCIKHLMYSLCIGQAAPYRTVEEAPETSILVQNISKDKSVAIFWFAAALVDEVAKTDMNSMKQHKFHERVVPNVEDIVPLIGKFIAEASPESDVKIRLEALKCFQSWVSYSHRAYIDKSEVALGPLRTLTRAAILSLVDANLYEIAVEIFSELLVNFSEFLRPDDFALLYSLFNSPWAQERYERLIHGDFEFDSVQYGLFMIAFGDANVQDLAEKAGTDPQSQQILRGLCGLLGAEGYAVNEDKIFVPALEFWTTFVETLIDSTYSEEDGNPSWFQGAQLYIMEVIQKGWRKIQFPPTEEFNHWDSVDRVGFKDARRDFGDLLQQYFLILGIPLLDIFINLARQSVSIGNWTELEASLYCLSRYADSLKSHEKQDEYLQRVFDPTLFDLFMNPPSEIPVRTMQTFLSLIREFSDYFQRHTENLPKALNITFGATTTPALAKTASQSIVELCSNCREILVPEVGAFLRQFETVAHSSLEGHVKEGILGGIASIIQAMPQETLKVAPLGQLLNFIDVDAQQCISSLEVAQVPDANAASELGLNVLTCLEAIAKGLQVPADKPIDLEKRMDGPPFWISGEGSSTQNRIISLMSGMFERFENRGEIIEAECHIFRCGFRESEPGPFVFAPEVVARFLLRASLRTARVGLLISTAGSLINSHKSDGQNGDMVSILLKWVTELLQNLGDPSNDPEIAQNAIEFFGRISQTYPSILLSQPPSSVEYIFMFTLRALTGADPLPKAASAEFWSGFISLPDQDPPLQAAINEALQQLGPLLAQALIYNISGHAARSELDKLSDPIKKLVARQVRSKAWLEAALVDTNFPSDTVSISERNMFLQKIMSLRGDRKTNAAVREFWLACRGSDFAYAS